MTGIAVAAAGLLLEIPYPNIDPVAIDLPGPVDVRWYGLGYLLGFLAGYFILRRLARRGFLRIDPDAVGDLIFALVVGVLLGGRLGYILFYELQDYARDPAQILRLWEGGLAFHGGLIGVVVAALWFARKHRVDWRNLADGVALGAGPGIFAVRIANFINGELYGRVASESVPWAMRFPTDPAARELLGMDTVRGMRARELAIDRAMQDGTWDWVKQEVPLRHPSQLYEALGEGVLTALVVWSLYLWNRRRGVQWGDGAYAGVVVLTYGAVRTVLELFRQPDVQFTSATDPVGTVLGPFTMGQLLSLGMIVAGLVLAVRGIRAAKRAAVADAS